MEIGGREVSPQNPYIVGEVALAHDGSLSLAHSYIDAIADTGANAVKFQMHAPKNGARWRVVPHWPQDENRNAYWKRTAFTGLQWIGLKGHANDRGLDFLCSPFSLEAFEEIDALGVPAWKIPSGQLTNHALLKRVAATGLPALLSTGMASWEEIQGAVDHLSTTTLALLQCSSLYPTPPERIGINIMDAFGRMGCLTGLSDHSGTIYPSLVALFHDASVIEVHVVLDRRMYGFDTASSVTPTELKQIVEGARFIRGMMAIDKNDLGPYEDARRVFM